MPHSEFLSWAVEDRAKAVAYFLEKNERCQVCGTSQWEWEENKFAYEAVEHFCQGCLHTSVLREQSGQKPGVTVILARTNTVEHAKRQKRAKQQWLSEMSRKRDSSG